MAKNKKFTVKVKRRRKGKTDYKLRLGLLKSGVPRIVVRKFLNNVLIQFVDYNPEGDKVLVSAYTKELSKEFGWKGHGGNVSSAYLVGLLAGLKAKKEKLGDSVIDFGLSSVVKGSALFACVKGLKDSGLNLKVNEKMFPSDDRVSGKTVVENIQKLDKQKLDKMYGAYKKKGLVLSDLAKHFEEVKKKILTKWQ